MPLVPCFSSGVLALLAIALADPSCLEIDDDDHEGLSLIQQRARITSEHQTQSTARENQPLSGDVHGVVKYVTAAPAPPSLISYTLPASTTTTKRNLAPFDSKKPAALIDEAGARANAPPAAPAFAPPAPTPESLIDQVGAHITPWVWQLLNYDFTIGADVGLDTPVPPTPAPPPYTPPIVIGTVATMKPVSATSSELEELKKQRANATRDCIVADWSEWSCCGCEPTPDLPGSHQVRYRPVTTPHQRFGRPCPALTEVKDCVPGIDLSMFSS